MAGRLALIMASECEALTTLGFPTDLAADLYDVLVVAGPWQPAINGGGLLLGPTLAEMRHRVDIAFRAADEARATLLITFIGHGVSTGPEAGTKDFYLMAHDSPAVPNFENSFHLAESIRHRLAEFPSIDGLIVLVDACEAEPGVRGAAARWLDVVGSGGRIDLMVAAGRLSAYDGCFTKVVTDVIKNGIARAGENLLSGDLLGELARRCQMQTPEHLSFSNGVGLPRSDPSLWLTPNVARVGDAVRGRPSAGLVDQLTRNLKINNTLKERLVDVINADRFRLRLIVGPQASGKSTIMSLLIRPALIETLKISAAYADAVVFLDSASTLENVTEEIVQQLSNRLSGFSEASRIVASRLGDTQRARKNTFEIRVEEPLRLAERQVRLLIDGLDQPVQGAREVILGTISRLTKNDANLEHVKVICSIRAGDEFDTIGTLGHARRIVLDSPNSTELAEVLDSSGNNIERPDVADSADIERQASSGGWLIPRLLGELRGHQHVGAALSELVAARLDELLENSGRSDAISSIVSLLVAAGSGPVVPLDLVTIALDGLGCTLRVSEVRDILASLGSIVSRGRAGQSAEQIGIAHARIVDALTVDRRVGSILTDAHRALAAAIDSCVDTAWAASYAAAAGPRHHLMSGNGTGAIRILDSLDEFRLADNRDRWSTWLPAFYETLGANHPDTLIARMRLAEWRGKSGDAEAALAELTQLSHDTVQLHESGSLKILEVQLLQADWLGVVSGPTDAQVRLSELLEEYGPILGGRNHAMLRARDMLAKWKRLGDDATGAVADLIRLVADYDEVDGPDSRVTLATRCTLARWQAEDGDTISALADFRRILDRQKRALGVDDTDTLKTESFLIFWQGRSGQPRALQMLVSHLSRLEDLVGPHHAQSLLARELLVQLHIEARDHASAATEQERLVATYERFYGAEHAETVKARKSLDDLKSNLEKAVETAGTAKEVLTYVTTAFLFRRAIGVVALTLPFVLIIGEFVSGEPELYSSLSAYYHSSVRDIFVSAMAAFGTFFLMYRGGNRLEDLSTSTAGIGVLGSALFPVSPGRDSLAMFGVLHLVFSGIFFLQIAYLSLYQFPTNSPVPSNRELIRNRIFRACGLVIAGSLSLIAVSGLIIPPSYLSSLHLVLWFESISYWSLGVSMLCKGQVLLVDSGADRES